MSDEKGYTIEMEDRGQYLWVLVGGKVLTAAISAAYWNEIAEACYERDCPKVLIEKDFEVPVGPGEMIKMADHLGKLLPSCRVAFVDRWRHDDINQLGKRLARNRDVLMQLFDDVAEAEKWLLAN